MAYTSFQRNGPSEFSTFADQIGPYHTYTCEEREGNDSLQLGLENELQAEFNRMSVDLSTIIIAGCTETASSALSKTGQSSTNSCNDHSFGPDSAVPEQLLEWSYGGDLASSQVYQGHAGHEGSTAFEFTATPSSDVCSATSVSGQARS